MRVIICNIYDYEKEPEKLFTVEIMRLVASIHEHKGRQDLFVEANKDELSTLLEVAKIQSTGASNRIEGIYTTDKRLDELVKSEYIIKIGSGVYTSYIKNNQ